MARDDVILNKGSGSEQILVGECFSVVDADDGVSETYYYSGCRSGYGGRGRLNISSLLFQRVTKYGLVNMFLDYGGSSSPYRFPGISGFIEVRDRGADFVELLYRDSLESE